MDWFQLAYTLAGGLGLFLFGMKGLSDGLQSLASSFIRKAINMITRNRVLAVFVGMLVTTFVQSSSISTVMMVGMLNAGLMNLKQSIGFILGANIGTTITGWIISIKVGKYGLLAVGIGIFPMLFASRERITIIGKLLFSLGMVFFGLELMGEAFKPLRTNTGFINMLTVFSADSRLSQLACMGIGCALTMIIQSSSAMLGITIALATQGVISFDTAAALVLGENIGTTITIWIASIGGNIAAKRSSLFHTLFNLFGVTIAFIIFKPYISFVGSIITGDPALRGADGSFPHAAAHIAAVHTFFNVSMTILFLPFLQYFERLLVLLIPQTSAAMPAKLTYLPTLKNLSPELAVNEANLLLIRMGNSAKDALAKTESYISAVNPDYKDAKEVIRIESQLDTMQYEITIFLSHTMSATLSMTQANLISRMIRIGDEIESITDYCQSAVKYCRRITESEESLDIITRKVLSGYLSRCRNFYEFILQALDNMSAIDMPSVLEKYDVLGKEADEIREKHLIYVRENKVNPIYGMTCSDIMVALRRIKNHSLNIAEAIAGGKARN